MIVIVGSQLTVEKCPASNAVLIREVETGKDIYILAGEVDELFEAIGKCLAESKRIREEQEDAAALEAWQKGRGIVNGRMARRETP